MLPLSIVAPNKNRLSPDNLSSQWFLKSLQWQDVKDFELIIVDGGSSNFDSLEKFIRGFGFANVRLLQHKIPDDFFHKTVLNNVGIRNAIGKYIMTTDVDILFLRDCISELSKYLDPNVFVDSRVFSWKSAIAQKIYNGELDPYNNPNACKIGRLKKEATCGAIQATHKDNWFRVFGYNEDFKGWGSEDIDLYNRMKMSGLKIMWMGTTTENVKVFHQPHPKKDIKKDLEWQEKNKVLLYNIKDYRVNPDGWGGVKAGD